MKSLINWYYGSKVTREGIPIAYLQAPRIYSSSAMSIIDYSNRIPENTFFEKEVKINLDENILTYFIDKKGFIITDKFNGEKPLYYKHVVQEPIYLDANGETDIVIVDENGIQQSKVFYQFDCGKKVIYHALGNNQVYFVIYPRVDDDNNVIEREHRELLEAKPAFHEVGPEDLDQEGCIKPDSDSYKIEELDGQPHFWRITLPRPTQYALLYTSDGLFGLRVPHHEQQEPWYIEITNTTLLTKQSNEKYLLKYNLPEFEVQNFYPFVPIRLVADKIASPIAEGILEVGEQDIVLTTKTPIDIKIYGPDGTLSQAITTDENKVGKLIKSIPWEVGLIRSIDKYNGRINLYRDIKPGEIAKVSFYYNASTLRYVRYNFNPLYNESALIQSVAILCKPYGLGCSASINHVVLDENNIVLEASDSEISDWINGSQTLDDLIEDWIYLPGISVDNQKNYMLLGLVRTSVTIAPEQLSIFDSRRRGGGISNSYVKQALHAVPGVSQNWDIGYWDGPQEPLQGALLLYLPTYIQNVYTEDEIRALGSKFAPAGTYFVIRYY